jgi:tetratricopeptide (TPR) repeat protein
MAQTLNNLGLAHYDLQQWREAEESFRESLALFQETGDVPSQRHMLNNLGMIYDAQEAWIDALTCYEQALGMCRELGDRRGEASILGNMAEATGRVRAHGEAIGLYQQAIALREASGDSLAALRARVNLCAHLLRRGESISLDSQEGITLRRTFAEALEQAAQLGAERELARLMQLQPQVETLTTSFAQATGR